MTTSRLILLASLTTILSACTTMHSGMNGKPSGLIELPSPYSVSATLDKVTTAGAALGFGVAARIDHAKAAQGAGLELRPTEVLLLGNPKGGTPLMQCAQTIAIDLPMKFLAYQDAAGKVTLAYNDPMYLKQRHHAQGCDDAFAKASTALNKIATEAVK